jgi:hypothetical protein
MKKWVIKHSLLSKIGLKGREKDRSRPLKDKKDISNFGRPLKDIFFFLKDAATPLESWYLDSAIVLSQSLYSDKQIIYFMRD